MSGRTSITRVWPMWCAKVDSRLSLRHVSVRYLGEFGGDRVLGPADHLQTLLQSVLPGHHNVLLIVSAAVFSTCGVGFIIFTIACTLSLPKQVSHTCQFFEACSSLYPISSSWYISVSFSRQKTRVQRTRSSRIRCLLAALVSADQWKRTLLTDRR